MDEARRSRRSAWIEAAAILLVGGGLCAFTWRSWADPLVDYGRELYGAWRLASGGRLGRDLAWLQGPLSVEWNALLFRAFGASYRTLFLADLAVLALVAWAARDLLRRAWGALGAAAAVVLTLAVSGFGQYAVVGNYAFAAPYAHELTHGFLLALLALVALERAADAVAVASDAATVAGEAATVASDAARVKRRARAWIVAAGLCVGLAALTKAEAFAGGAAAALVRLALFAATLRGGTARAGALLAGGATWARAGALFAGGVLVPPLVAALALLPGRTLEEALGVTLGAFAQLGNAELRALPFYRALAGVDAPVENVDRMLRWTLGVLAVVGVPALAARFARAPWMRSRAFAAVVLVAAAALGWLAREHVAWRDLGRPFPLLVLALLADAGVGVARARDAAERRRHALRAALGVLALALLARMLLAARLLHYGFVLALPAAWMVVCAMVEWIPRWVGARGGSARSLRALYLGLLVAGAAVHVETTATWVARDREELGAGADRMRVSTRGKLAAAALEEIRARSGPASTLLVVPEGVTLAYLARLRTPTRHVNFMPPEMIVWSEAAILAELDATPPDLVAIVQKDTSEYGYPRFGRDYGARLWAWVHTRYHQVALVGDPPLNGTGFGIAILERRQ